MPSKHARSDHGVQGTAPEQRLPKLPGYEPPRLCLQNDNRPKSCFLAVQPWVTPEGPSADVGPSMRGPAQVEPVDELV